MNLIPTELNRQLAGAVLNRIAAERSSISGRSGFWRLVGIGIISFGIGAATGIGFYGYSYILQRSDNLVSVFTILSKSLSEVRLQGTATGTVAIEGKAISLAKGQLVSLDPNARLKMESGAEVKADGEIKIQTPTISGLPSQQGTQRTNSNSAVTNFTIFKNVPFEKGKVLTGWTFLTSAQKFPTSQYCYYTENSESPGLDIVVNIATDGKIDSAKNVPSTFDITAAFEKCVWFKSDIP